MNVSDVEAWYDTVWLGSMNDDYLSAAFRKAQDDSGEIKAPYFRVVEIFPEEQADLYLIPTKVGAYDSLCTIAGHEEARMFGPIVVEPANYLDFSILSSQTLSPGALFYS